MKLSMPHNRTEKAMLGGWDREPVQFTPKISLESVVSVTKGIPVAWLGLEVLV